jgi:hypothetical protein
MRRLPERQGYDIADSDVQGSFNGSTRHELTGVRYYC